MFKPDEELLHIANHISGRFHAMIGLDPLGNFQEIDGLTYEVPPFEYKELGRNHAPWRLPMEGPATPGELTLKWGMIIRSKLFDWVHDVKLGKDFQKDVYLFQLSHLGLPLRIYQLSGAWPVKWESSPLTVASPQEMATETVTLAYDNIDMANLSLLAMAGDLVAEPIAALVEKLRPKKAGGVARDSQHQSLGQAGFYHQFPGSKDILGKRVDVAPAPGEFKALERFKWTASEEDYEALAPPKRDAVKKRDYRAKGRSPFRKALEGAYKAAGGDHHLDPLEDDYLALGRDSVVKLGAYKSGYKGTGRGSVAKVEAGPAYEAVAGEAVLAGEGLKVEKDGGDA